MTWHGYPTPSPIPPIKLPSCRFWWSPPYPVLAYINKFQYIFSCGYLCLKIITPTWLVSSPTDRSYDFVGFPSLSGFPIGYIQQFIDSANPILVVGYMSMISLFKTCDIPHTIPMMNMTIYEPTVHENCYGSKPPIVYYSGHEHIQNSWDLWVSSLP